MGSKSERDEFQSLYAKVNGVSITTTPTQSASLDFRFSPQDIRDTINAPCHTNSQRAEHSHINFQSRKTDSAYNYYQPSPIIFGSGGFSQPCSPSPTNSMPGTPWAWNSGSQDNSSPTTPPSSPPTSPTGFPPSATLHWGPSQQSHNFPSSPTRFFSSKYKRAPQRRADAQGEHVYLDLEAQLLILSKTQTLLEHACFTFAQQHLPHVLDETGWDCPIAGELNVWMHHFAVNGMAHWDVPRDFGIREPISRIMDSAKQIRHNAVHRNKVPVTELAAHLDHAVALCMILVAHEELDEVKAIRDYTNTKIASRIAPRIAQLKAETEEVGKDIMQFLKSR
ncbi:ubiquinol-cytochrome-c reductase cytochrome c1 [Fusarium sporotrichioides]|uniref:Ubiquinol-cytochrome-c reductase cytochrome c1 n=1 Tax=Fusarium sporotrichioides TaxID=5514 RepID=A0A395SUU5_FUSSP|nr:ubiquinol-cytochrome-c reductase cytochrome c1 [Fusarium sporotrichioides]